jgi:hypothetical protein
MSELDAAKARIEELEAEIDRLKRGYGTELMETEEALAQALGMTEDPDYGYPVGDHTTVTLAWQVRDAKSELQKQFDAAEARVKELEWELALVRRTNTAAITQLLDSGDGHGQPSQIRITNLESQPREALIAEIHHLNNRLCWMYSHYDQQGTINISIVLELTSRLKKHLDVVAAARAYFLRYEWLLKAYDESPKIGVPGVDKQAIIDLLRAVAQLEREEIDE